VAEQVQLLPGLFVDLDTFPRHGPAFCECVKSFLRLRNGAGCGASMF
jgi:hypothetical protein